jgi:hypothetical protein
MTAPAILIIEDDDFQYEIYEEALSKYKLIRVKNGTEALAAFPVNGRNSSSSTTCSPMANSVLIFCRS